MRYTRTIKAQLITVIDYLLDDGHQEAVEKLMNRIHLSPEELSSWRHRHKLRGENGLRAQIGRM